jgi:3-dehydroquinate synthase
MTASSSSSTTAGAGAPGAPPAAAHAQPLVPPVVLLGPPGAGKSALAPLLAARLGFASVDLDERIGVHQLVDDGEAGFRVREFLALQAALQEGAVVIAAGAGIVDTAAARALLARACCVVVDVDVGCALARIADDTRPWLPANARGHDARVAAWTAREAARPTRRAALAHERRVTSSTDTPLAALAEALERHVRAWRPVRAPGDDVVVAAHDGTLSPGAGFVIADRVVAPRLARVDLVIDDAARKDEARLLEVLRALHARGVRRHDTVVAVGGGALLDVVGLACALHHRGTRWHAVPTTLLAMVDAALGGKTAVDIDVDGAVVRNGAGAFHAPGSTTLWRGFLHTLGDAQLRHGRAEMAKHALLCGDEDELRRATTAAVDDDMIATSRALKCAFVDVDPHERHLRMALNLGHTFAHALESRLGLAHGDAVVHGLQWMLQASTVLAGLDLALARRLSAALAALDAPALPPLSDDDVDALIIAMARDKKARAALRLVLLAGPGQALLVESSTEAVRGILRADRGARGPR